MHRKGEGGVASGAAAQCLAINREPLFQLVRRVDQRRREDRQAAARRERKGIGAVGGDPYRRVGRLHRPRRQVQLARPEVFAAEREGFAAPRADDEVERLLEPLAAFLHRDRIAFVMQGRGAASDPEFQPSVAEDVGDRGLFGDLDRVVQRQERHRRAEPDAGCPLRRRRQHHQRVGQDRKRAAEMQFAEPHRIEADLVPEFDLTDDVVVALLLRIAGRTGQLVEKPEAHGSSPGPILGFSRDSTGRDRRARQAGRAR